MGNPARRGPSGAEDDGLAEPQQRVHRLRVACSRPMFVATWLAESRATRSDSRISRACEGYRRAMSFDTFEAVRALPEPSLRELLGTGESAERVWAAWALALRLGADADGVVRDAATCEPDGGIRRHFVVLLAGFGEAAAVAALASGDPDPFVRATAHQYVARLAVRFPELWALVKGGLADPAALVRTTLVLQLPAEAPAEVREACLRAVDDAELDVRRAVAEQLDLLLREEPLPAHLRARALSEPDREVRLLLLDAWRRHDGLPSLFAAVAGRDDVALEALEVSIRADPLIPWSQVEPLAAGGGDVASKLLSLFAQRTDEMPLGWHVRLVAEVVEDFPWSALILTPRLARGEPLDAAARAALVRLLEWAKGELESEPQDWGQAGDAVTEWQEQLHEWQAQLHALIEAGGRFID